MKNTSQDIHILMLAPLFPPFRGAVSSRLESFARHWSKLARVTVISAYPGEAKEKGYSLIKFPLARWRFEPLKIIFIHSKLHSLVKDLNPDVIFVSIPPVWPLVEGVLIAQRLGKRLILDIRDLPTADSRIVVNSLLRKIFYRLTVFISKYFGKKASRIATVTYWLREEVKKFYNFEENRVYVISNGSETASFKASLSIPKEFDVVYAGTLIYVRNPTGILRLLNEVRRFYPSLKALIISNLDTQVGRLFLKEIHELKLGDNVFVNEPCFPAELPMWLGKAKLGLNSLIPDLQNYRGAIGAKEYEYLAAGLPIVGLMDPDFYVESGKLIVGNGAGIMNQDPRQLAKETAALLKDTVRLRKMSKRAREVGMRFDRKKLAEECYYKVILPLIKNP